MNSACVATPEWLVRQRFRSLSRQVQQSPENESLHLERIEAGMHMRGSEPLQGAMADWFCARPVSAESLAIPVVEAALEKLPVHARQSFCKLVQQNQPLPNAHRLATRWSVLSTASAELPARARRASSDEARRMAQILVQALQDSALEAPDIEAHFLAHCAACQDKLAFMLARRELLRSGVYTQLPKAWQEVAQKLESLHEPGLQA